MGGRGAKSASNPYFYWSRERISGEMNKVGLEIRKKQITAAMDASGSAAIKRKVNAAKKSISELDKKYSLLEKALNNNRTKNNLF